jgi:hypothetical protein
MKKGKWFLIKESLGNRDPSARWTFFDPSPPRFAAKTKLALRAQTVVFADAPLRGQGAPKNLQCALSGSDFQVARSLSGNPPQLMRKKDKD